MYNNNNNNNRIRPDSKYDTRIYFDYNIYFAIIT